MRNKKLAWNTCSALIYQVAAVLCGFILPRAILNRYGSEVNGLVNSILAGMVYSCCEVCCCHWSMYSCHEFGVLSQRVGTGF